MSSAFNKSSIGYAQKVLPTVGDGIRQKNQDVVNLLRSARNASYARGHFRWRKTGHPFPTPVNCPQAKDPVKKGKKNSN